MRLEKEKSFSVKEEKKLEMEVASTHLKFLRSEEQCSILRMEVQKLVEKLQKAEAWNR